MGRGYHARPRCAWWDGKAGRPTHLLAMQTFLTVLLVMALLGVVAALGAGLLGMVKGTQDGMRSNKLMQYRVAFQGLAVLLFVALMYVLKG